MCNLWAAHSIDWTSDGHADTSELPTAVSLPIAPSWRGDLTEILTNRAGADGRLHHGAPLKDFLGGGSETGSRPGHVSFRAPTCVRFLVRFLVRFGADHPPDGNPTMQLRLSQVADGDGGGRSRGLVAPSPKPTGVQQSPTRRVPRRLPQVQQPRGPWTKPIDVGTRAVLR